MSCILFVFTMMYHFDLDFTVGYRKVLRLLMLKKQRGLCVCMHVCGEV